MKNLMLTGLCALTLIAAQGQTKARKAAPKIKLPAPEWVQGMSFKTMLAMHLGVPENSLENDGAAVAATTTVLPAALNGYTLLGERQLTDAQGQKLRELRLGKLPMERKYAYVADNGALLALTDRPQAMDQQSAMATIRY